MSAWGSSLASSSGKIPIRIKNFLVARIVEFYQAKALRMDPHPVDIHVGSRLRLARTFRKLSQSALAKSIGVTFQQVQKYETGANRVSASRLVELAAALEIDVAFFFQDLPRDVDPGATQALRGPQPNAIDTEIAVELACVSDVHLKRILLALMRQLARKWQEAQKPTSPIADPEGDTVDADMLL